MKSGTVQFLFCCDKTWTTKYRATKRNIKKSKGTILTYNEEPHDGYSQDYNKKCKKCYNMFRATITYEIGV